MQDYTNMIKYVGSASTQSRGSLQWTTMNSSEIAFRCSESVFLLQLEVYSPFRSSTTPVGFLMFCLQFAPIFNFQGQDTACTSEKRRKSFLCLSDITGKKRISERSPLHRNPGGRKDLFPILSLIVGFRTRAGQVRTYSCPGHNSWYWIMKFHIGIGGRLCIFNHIRSI